MRMAAPSAQQQAPGIDSRQRSRFVVYAAAAANLAIAATKFVVAAVGGSSALLCEGVHSLIDTGNELLILLGMGCSRRPPDPDFPFGYSRELYFWTFIVALLMFGGGGGVALYEGISRLRRPVEVGDPFWAYLVIAVATVFEATSFAIALCEMLRRPIPGSLWQKIHSSKDPAVFTVLIEDLAALARAADRGDGDISDACPARSPLRRRGLDCDRPGPVRGRARSGIREPEPAAG